MKPVILIGGGGHAKVIIEILEADAAFEVIGCVASAASNATVLGTPILGDDACLPDIYASGVRHAFIAIGTNDRRRRLSKMVAEMGFELISAISRQAIISSRAELKQGVAIMPGAIINSCSQIGAGAVINTGVSVDHDCAVGDWAHLAPGTSLAGNVSIGEGAFLGVGARVIPEIMIGSWSIVGAGAVVVRNLPSNVTAVGVPARIISSRAAI